MHKAAERRDEVAAAPASHQASARTPPFPLASHHIAHLARAPAAQRTAAIADLNARVGNRRVALTIGARAVQREAKFGLMKNLQVTSFADAALAFWRENPNKTLEEFANHLKDQLNAKLTANGVPNLPAPKLTSQRVAGGFATSDWTVQFDLARTAAHPLTAKISQLPADRVAEVAGMYYHEWRHAEQAFLAARLVASEAKGAKDAKAIAAELDLPVPIAQAALNATGPLPGGREGLDKIRAWRAFHEGGTHRDYWDWNESLKQFVGNVIKSLPSPQPEGRAAIAAALGKLSPTLAEWRKSTVPFADNKVAKLKGTKKRDATDDQVLRDLTATRRALKKVMDAETATIKQLGRLKARQDATAAKTKPPLTVHQAKILALELDIAWLKLDLALGNLGAATDKAYRSYPFEADAYKAQQAVMKEIKAKTAPPTRKKTAPPARSK